MSLQIGHRTYGLPIIKKWNKNDSYAIIGKYCSISENVSIVLGGEHHCEWITTFPIGAFLNNQEHPDHPKTKGPIIIGNDVWICDGVLILSGVTVGDGAVLGANAVVTKDVAPYSIVAGNPAKLIKKRFTEEEIESLLRIAWWDWEEDKIKEAIPLLESSSIKEFIRKYENK